MIADVLNSHSCPVRMEITATKQILTLQVRSTDQSKLKYFPVNETLSQSSSTDESESKGIIVNKCSTEEDESEFVIKKQKDANVKTDYEESSVTYDVPSYFNVFKCERNILKILDVSYERVCMDTPRDEYYTKMLDTLIGHNYRHNAPLSNENLLQPFRRVMAEM